MTKRRNQNAAGAIRKRDPRDAAIARMNLYRPEYWDILQSAMRHESYQRVFQSHNDANAFVSRYYKFRADAIEAQTQGSRELLFLKAVGVDGEGNTFNTRFKWAPPPFTITWHYEGASPPASVSVPSAMPDLPHQAPIQQPRPKEPDAAEELTAKIYGKSKVKDKDEEIQSPGPHICTEWNEYDICVEPTCMKPKDIA